MDVGYWMTFLTLNKQREGLINSSYVFIMFFFLCRNNQAGEVEPSPLSYVTDAPRDSGRHAARCLSRRDVENPITKVGVSEHLLLPY